VETTSVRPACCERRDYFTAVEANIMSNFQLQAATPDSRPTGISYFRQSEQRLEALSELLEEELCGAPMDDARLTDFTKRITGDVDQAMAEETSWYDTVEFN